MIEIIIDGKKIEVAEGTTILDAARKNGIPIPTLCHRSTVEPYGACRLCIVDIREGNRTRLVTSCNYPVRKPVEVNTQSEKVRKTRKTLLEMMLSRWPNVNLIKQLAREYGVTSASYTHPLVDYSSNACILCGLCVNACSEIMWEDIIGFAGRGENRRVVMPFEKHYDACVGCSTCANICPTGAIQMTDDPNHPADDKRISRYGARVTDEVALYDIEQCRMREVGTAHLTEIMNDYDLLPTCNYKFGSHDEAGKLHSDVFKNKYLTQGVPDGCWLGCTMACAKVAEHFELKTGPYRGEKVLVDGPEYETVAGCGANMGIFDPEFVLETNFYCDTYGIDTISFGTTMAFVMECYEKGILNKERTGGLELRFGSAEAALEILHQMGTGQGFGVIVGQGIRRLKKIFAEKYNLSQQDIDFMQDIGMEAKGLEYSEYVTKESLAMQGGYGLALKGAQHDEAWLIFMDMVNNQIPTFQDKAEALHYFPMFRTWFGLVGLCKLPWNDVEPVDNAETDEPAKVPKHVEGYVNYFSGMTGREIDKKELILMSERVYNFQRVFNFRLGFGTREHDRIPYRSAGPVTDEEYESRAERYDKQLMEKWNYDITGKSTTEKREYLRKSREQDYQSLCDAVYRRRGWDENGVPTIEKMKQLKMDFPEVIAVLEKYYSSYTARSS
ncbi:MAG: (2Fe-2S)-binding protein [Candidatus Cloacimonetes bacterium]|nr:(2Fe-2S)-binding protein [Candidatus Cloacimonadota bacterium]